MFVCELKEEEDVLLHSNNNVRFGGWILLGLVFVCMYLLLVLVIHNHRSVRSTLLLWFGHCKRCCSPQQESVVVVVFVCVM